MIDLANEEVVSLGVATTHLPRRRRGTKPHASTLYRWGKEGVKADDGTRVVLETIRVGRTLCTSVEALQRFCDRLTAGPAVRPTPMVVAADRPDDGRADREAAKRGL